MPHTFLVSVGVCRRMKNESGVFCSAEKCADAREKAMQQWHNTPQYVWFFGQVLFLYTHATEKRQEKKGRRWDDIGALF